MIKKCQSGMKKEKIEKRKDSHVPCPPNKGEREIHKRCHLF
jgi:hypothetical protein